MPGETSQTEHGGRMRVAHSRATRRLPSDGDNNPRRPRGTRATGWGNARKRAVRTLTHWVSEYAGCTEGFCNVNRKYLGAPSSFFGAVFDAIPQCTHITHLLQAAF